MILRLLVQRHINRNRFVEENKEPTKKYHLKLLFTETQVGSPEHNTHSQKGLQHRRYQMTYHNWKGLFQLIPHLDLWKLDKKNRFHCNLVKHAGLNHFGVCSRSRYLCVGLDDDGATIEVSYKYQTRGIFTVCWFVALGLFTVFYILDTKWKAYCSTGKHIFDYRSVDTEEKWNHEKSTQTKIN